MDVPQISRPANLRVKLGGNYAKATGSGKEANFYFPGPPPFFFVDFYSAAGKNVLKGKLT
jgi:hypothetical protein